MRPLDKASTFDASSPAAELSPISSYLRDLHDKLQGLTGGSLADYIPELSKAKPDWFGIAIATVDGEVYTVGDCARAFSIQSVSKPFMYGYGLREHGEAFVLNHVGVEPTGEAFNSIVLDDRNNRPFNPMVNAGAMAVAELMKGADNDERARNMVELFSGFAGRPLDIDDAVFQSELATGHRNRAIAYMMLNSGMISRDPADLLDLYFKQCSVRVTCQDLAMMAATLANDGVNPATGNTILGSDDVRDVLTVMHSCGMYNYAGQWAYEVGLPAKSGVSGGIIAVIPGQLGIGVFSPPVDAHGNSVRGVAVCKEISEHFGLHAFNNRNTVNAVVRRRFRGDAVGSNRLRSQKERRVLDHLGGQISVLELQGPLYFGSVERLLREVDDAVETSGYLIIDFKRVRATDAAAVKLVQQMVATYKSHPCRLIFSHLRPDGPLADLYRSIFGDPDSSYPRHLESTDAALEICEDEVLADHPDHDDRTKFALQDLDVFAGLTADEFKALEPLIHPMHFSKGDVIIRKGDPANLFFVLARGNVSVYIKESDNKRHRVACIGPGLTFGEMALLDGGARSADIIADENVVCYGLSVAALKDISETRPNIMVTILSNIAREFSARLRYANEEILALE